ncbi:GLABRA2 expression modulator-like [Hibiscus syriacus]|uniref:GLABRA2 expression modulator-like n=1 Tax=Hibiscus syriacus TaxID=106335 RepID=UPI001923AD41|nr:GLABRA2 expression modulator-like [Hibiscus syriacus]
MEQSKTVAEPKSRSKQPPAEESHQKESDPAMDAEGFVMVSTTEPEVQQGKQTQNPRESEIQSEQMQSPNQTSSGSRKTVHWSPESVSESPAADHGVAGSAPDGPNPYIAHDSAPESFSTSFKGKQLDIYSDFSSFIFFL